MHGPLAPASKSIRQQMDMVRQAFSEFRDVLAAEADDTEELDESLAAFNAAIDNLRMQFDRHLETHNRRLVRKALYTDIMGNQDASK